MKTVLITGASRGIGRAAAERFAAGGYSVAVNYNNSETEAVSLRNKLLSLGCDCEIFKADVSSRTEVESMKEDIHRRFGRICTLVNNAGFAQQKLFSDITGEEWQRMFDVHVNGAFNTIQSFLPDFFSLGEGSIVNISSMWGITGGSCEVHYSAAKAALIGMSKALAKELGPSHIRVNCVAPGVVATDMCSGFDEATMNSLAEETPLMRIGEAAEIAESIFFISEQKFITGQVLNPNGGILI